VACTDGIPVRSSGIGRRDVARSVTPDPASRPAPDAASRPAPDARAAFPIVAMVSWAAASETLARVLAPLPADFPAAVVAMHAGPAGTDRTQARALSSRLRLPVSLAADDTALVPGRVLLVPSNRQALVGSDGWLRVVTVCSAAANRRLVEQGPSPDLLLLTLAEACGPRAVAVLLSGRGRPGTLGAQVVHAYGGRALVRGRPVAEALSRGPVGAGLPPSPALTLETIAPLLSRVCAPATARP
jgi:two-component system, chemotaxis family, protein-glutamate methylesterase/glutaminase